MAGNIERDKRKNQLMDATDVRSEENAAGMVRWKDGLTSCNSDWKGSSRL